MKDRLSRGLSGLWLWLPILALLGPAIACGRFWAPSDGISQNFPLRQLMAACVAQGELPFWNPYTWSGAPLLATMHGGFFFPGNWPNWFFSLADAANWTLAFALFVAGSGMATFARECGMRPVAVSLCASIWMLSGWMTQHTEHIQMIQVVGLTPWILWGVERCLQASRGWAAPGLGMLAACQILAGHPQMTAYSWLVVGAYALWRLSGLDRQTRRHAIWRVFGAGGLALGLSAPQWLVTLDYIADTQRRHVDYAWLTVNPVVVKSLPGLWMPYLFGARDPLWHGVSPWWGGKDWDAWFQGYVGVAGVLPILFAVVFWRREPAIRFWGAIATCGFLLSLGATTPLYRLWSFLPVVSQMPYASRHLMEVTLALSLLAGFGLHHWLALPRADALRLLARASAVLLGGMGLVLFGLAVFGGQFAARTQALMPKRIDLLAALNPWQMAMLLPVVILLTGALLLAWHHRKPAWGWAFICLICADLLLFARMQGLEFVLPHRASASTLPAHIPPFAEARQLTLSGFRYPNCYDCDILAHLIIREYPNVAALGGHRTVNGYDAFVPARYAALLGMDSFGHVGEYNDQVFAPQHHALDLLNMGELMLEASLADTPVWQKRLTSPRWEPLTASAALVRYRNRRACGAAWRVRQVTRAGEPRIVARLREPDFRPRHEALVMAGRSVHAPLVEGPVILVRPSFNTLTVRTMGRGPGFVVVSEGYDRGWRASIGEREIPVNCVDSVIMGVDVPAGPVTVNWRYEPRLWRVACVMGVASVVVLLVWTLLILMAGRRLKMRHG